MSKVALVLPLALAAFVACREAAAQDPPRAGGEPSYPRIANLYGAGLSWKPFKEGLPYWKKLGMIIGGGSDWHNDYDSPQAAAAHSRALAATRALRAENPRIRVLPYYDIIEGPDNPSLPKEFWLRDASGARISTWPGFYRVDTKIAAVIEQTRRAILARAFKEGEWDGAFLDCWEPDGVLVPALRAAAAGRFIVTNAGRLPSVVSPLANGAMSEDELDLVAAGSLEFSDLMDRYLRWCRDSAKPALSVVSCYPRTIDCDPWRWAARSEAERRRIVDEGRTADPAMMRFGLCFTLMGDGYFAYDAGTQVRGGDWWYPEYDAPLGDPAGPARQGQRDVWTRDFEGAVVMVNGSLYDEGASFDRPMKDASTGRVARSFAIPRMDGRIFLRTDESENAVPADPPLFVRSGSSSILRETGADGAARWQFPGGLELFFSPSGLLRSAAWKGEILFRGGYPNIALKEWKNVESRKLVEPRTPDPSKGGREFAWEGSNAWSSTGDAKGDFLADDWRIDVRLEDGRATIAIEDRFRALGDFDLSMWRHFLFLPVEEWSGRRAALRDAAGGAPRTLTLPAELGESDLGGGKVLELERGTTSVRVASSLPFSLADHRRWNTRDYLWAGYPAGDRVRKGWSAKVGMTIEIEDSR
jgi:hypothetical protein